jgi:predicted transcriptional regulator
MPRHASRFPTELEMAILRVVWKTGPCLIGEVRTELKKFRMLAYNSVLTIMNIMVQKGYLKRQMTDRAFIYQAAVTRESVQRGMMADLVERLFEGSSEDAIALIKTLGVKKGKTRKTGKSSRR